MQALQLPLLHNFPQRQPLRHFGGKWELAPWIIGAIARYFPHHQGYVEPYGGGYGVGLQKNPVGLEVYNDCNPTTVNFWRLLRDRPDELIPRIEASPRTWEEYEVCRQTHLISLEQARRTYIEAQLSYCGTGTRWASGTTDDRLAKDHDDSMLWPTTERMKDVLIQEMDAIACIEMWDGRDTVFYVDPPYLQAARKSRDSRHTNGAPRRQYAYEMSEAQHIELGEFLRTVKGGVLVSGYDSPLYDSLFDGWVKLSKSVPGNAGNTLECLWINQSCL